MVIEFKNIFAMFTRWLLLGTAVATALNPVLSLPLRGVPYASITKVAALLGAYVLTYQWELERDVTPHYVAAVFAASMVVWFVVDFATVLPPASTRAGGVSRFLVGVGILAVCAYAVKRYFASRTTDG